MRLQKKLLVIVGLSWLGSVAILAAFSYHLFVSWDYILPLSLSGLFVLAVTWWLLKKYIVDRLIDVHHQIKDIDNASKFSHRVTVSGRDEVNDMASSINDVLEFIQTSHDTLEKRVKERTDELEKANERMQADIKRHRKIEKQLQEIEDRMKEISHKDRVTGLANRFLLRERLAEIIQDEEKKHEKFAVMFINLDRFKLVNDALGIPGGDIYLKHVADKLQKLAHEHDLVARRAADEFVFVLANVPNDKKAASLAQYILTNISETIEVDGHHLELTGSIGISHYPQDGESVEELLSKAELAMKRAKSKGGNKHSVYTEAIDVASKEALVVEANLRRALKNNELVLFYQPLVSMVTNEITGFEALIRWNDPEKGLIPPIQFIPVAEQSHLICQIGDWVLKEASKTLKSWVGTPLENAYISVNCTARQFQMETFLSDLKALIKENDISPEKMLIEITESAIMDDPQDTIEKLHALREMGFSIAVDDFGTGYSSLSYLKDFPVQYLKLDGKFVRQLPENQEDKAITNAVLAMGHSLGLKVIAEGIEEIKQLNYLKEHGCDRGQGYYYHKPMALMEVEQFFGEGFFVKEAA